MHRNVDSSYIHKSRWENKARTHQEENSYTDWGVSGTIDFFKAKAEKELWGHATVWQKNPDTTAGREGEAKGYTLYHSSGSSWTVRRLGWQSPLGGADWEGAGGHFWSLKLTLA